MILSTTPQIEGYRIREYKGVVTGETIIGANFLKDFMAGIRDIVGGRSSSYEKVLRQGHCHAGNDRARLCHGCQRHRRHRHRLRDHRQGQLHAHGSHQRHRRGHLNEDVP